MDEEEEEEDDVFHHLWMLRRRKRDRGEAGREGKAEEKEEGSSTVCE